MPLFCFWCAAYPLEAEKHNHPLEWLRIALVRKNCEDARKFYPQNFSMLKWLRIDYRASQIIHF